MEWVPIIEDENYGCSEVTMSSEVTMKPELDVLNSPWNQNHQKPPKTLNTPSMIDELIN